MGWVLLLGGFGFVVGMGWMIGLSSLLRKPYGDR